MKLNKKDKDKALKLLSEMYPDAKPELNYKTAYELLIAVILSAQCTDKRVNIITENLFKNYNTAKKMIHLTEEELGELIKSAGLYKNKSKNILKASRMIIEEYGGEVPNSRESLEKLPGVGRKTASVVLSVWFDTPAIAVDTHVFRVSNRIGIVNAKTINLTEKQLMETISIDLWSKAHHWFIFHGRRLCKARKPLCEKCNLNEICIFYKNDETR